VRLQLLSAVFALCFCLLTTAQTPVVSDVERHLARYNAGPGDDARSWVISALFLGDFYRSNPQQATVYYEAAAKEAAKAAYNELVYNAHIKKAQLYRNDAVIVKKLEASLKELDKGQNSREILQLKLMLASAYLRFNQAEKAVKIYEEVLPEYRKSAQKADLAMALSHYANAQLVLNQSQQALELGEVVSSIAAKAQAPKLELQGMMVQARALQQLKQSEAAIRMQAALLEKAEQQNDIQFQRTALMGISQLLVDAGDWQKAIPYVEKALQLKGGQQDAESTLFLQARIIKGMLVLGRLEEAKNWIDQAQELAAGRKLKGETYIQLLKGKWHFIRGEQGLGIDLMQRALVKPTADNDRGALAEERLLVANYFSEKGLFKQAESQFDYLHKQKKMLAEADLQAFELAWEQHLFRKNRKKQSAETEAVDLPRQESKKRVDTRVLAVEDSIQRAWQAERIKLLETQRLQENRAFKQAEFRAHLLILLFVSLFFALGFGWLWFRNRRRHALLLAEKEKQILALQLEEARKEKKLTRVDALLEGQETERRRIAEQLHDDVGSMLSALKLQLESFENEKASQKAAQSLRKARHMVDELSDDVRQLSHVLMPGAMARFGFRKAIELYVEQLNSSGKLHFELMITGFEQTPPHSLALSAYRILLELCNNVLKHANAKNVLVELVEHPDQWVIVVEDNGQGFEPIDNGGDGIGLQSIESRIQLLGGRFEVNSSPGRGTSIVVELPC
jgi:signal transduction histidine kinase